MKLFCSFVLIVVLLPAVTRSEAADPQTNSSDPVAVAIDHLRNLDYEQAIQQLQSWLETHREDLCAHNYLGISVLYQEMKFWCDCDFAGFEDVAALHS